MVTGYKSGTPAEGIRSARWVVAALLIAGIAALWAGVVPVTEQASVVKAVPTQRAQQRHDG